MASWDQIQILSGLAEGIFVAASANFLIDAESNLGAAMAGMAGLDYSGMEMGGEETDHSGHDMGGEPAGEPSGKDSGGDETDHSGHDMGNTGS